MPATMGRQCLYLTFHCLPHGDIVAWGCGPPFERTWHVERTICDSLPARWHLGWWAGGRRAACPSLT